MKRKTTLYFLLFSFFCVNCLIAQTTNIPDAQFEQYLIDKSIDSDGIINQEVLTNDISGMTILDIQGYNISDFEGLQFFTTLTNFTLINNQAAVINEIDFFGNSALTNLTIINTPNLSQINILQNINLVDVVVVTRGDLFETIDVSTNINLTSLSVADNKISSLNILTNINLTYLSVAINPITSIDVSNLTELENLSTYESQITSLDLSQNIKLTSLNSDDGKLKNVNLKNGFNSILTSVELNNNPDLSCILVDNEAYSGTATGWVKDATATFIENAISFNIEAQNITIQYDSSGNYRADFDAWLADNGGAEATSICGEINWSYYIETFFVQNSIRIIYEVSFYATDIFGIKNRSFATLVVENIQHFTDDIYGSGNTICDDIFDINTVITDIEPTASLKLADISNITFSRVSNGEFNEGPLGASFNGTDVDFPDTGAGSFSYLFLVQVKKSLTIYNPTNGDFELKIIEDEATITLNDKTVAFQTEEIDDITVCSGDISSIQNLTDLLEITPNPNVLEPQNPIDLNQYWTPSVYSGSGTYTFDPTNAFPNCPSNAVSITVTEELPLSPGSNSTLLIPIGGTVTEAQLFVALEGEDAGGVWSPLPLAGAGTYTYTHTTTACPIQSAVVVVTESVLSVYENEFLNDLVLYPNPTQNMIYLKGDISLLKSIAIYSTKGQEIMRATDNLETIDVSMLKSTVYFVKLQTENATKVAKIIKR